MKEYEDSMFVLLKRMFNNKIHNSFVIFPGDPNEFLQKFLITKKEAETPNTRRSINLKLIQNHSQITRGKLQKASQFYTHTFNLSQQFFIFMADKIILH